MQFWSSIVYKKKCLQDRQFSRVQYPLLLHPQRCSSAPVQGIRCVGAHIYKLVIHSKLVFSGVNVHR